MKAILPQLLLFIWALSPEPPDPAMIVWWDFSLHLTMFVFDAV